MRDGRGVLSSIAIRWVSLMELKNKRLNGSRGPISKTAEDHSTRPARFLLAQNLLRNEGVNMFKVARFSHGVVVASIW